MIKIYHEYTIQRKKTNKHYRVSVVNIFISLIFTFQIKKLRFEMFYSKGKEKFMEMTAHRKNRELFFAFIVKTKRTFLNLKKVKNGNN